MSTLRISAFLFLSLVCVMHTHAGVYSSHSGFTPGATDNPIARGDIATFESWVVDYRPSPGVGPNFQDFSAGLTSLGDRYSPVARPGGIGTGFDSRYRPATGTKPNAFHAGLGSSTSFGGDVNDPSDTYGFLGIDDAGSITLGFETPIADGVGADFAVFENGFGFGGPTSLFAELAYVEVSSNGSDFLRFSSISLNTAPTVAMGAFQGYDATNIYNLAGKHANNWGTPFDLSELSPSALVQSGALDLNSIRYVRLVDVAGSGDLMDGNGIPVAGIDRDSLGNAILDNYATFDSSGFDYVGLTKGAVGVLNVAAVPEPASFAIFAVATCGLLWRRRRRTLNSLRSWLVSLR